MEKVILAANHSRQYHNVRIALSLSPVWFNLRIIMVLCWDSIRLEHVSIFLYVVYCAVNILSQHTYTHRVCTLIENSVEHSSCNCVLTSNRNREYLVANFLIHNECIFRMQYRSVSRIGIEVYLLASFLLLIVISISVMVAVVASCWLLI